MKRGVIANVFPFNISSFLVSKSEPTLLVFLSWAEFVQYSNCFIVANTIVGVERLQTQDDTTELSPTQARWRRQRVHARGRGGVHGGFWNGYLHSDEIKWTKNNVKMSLLYSISYRNAKQWDFAVSSLHSFLVKCFRFQAQKSSNHFCFTEKMQHFGQWLRKPTELHRLQWVGMFTLFNLNCCVSSSCCSGSYILSVYWVTEGCPKPTENNTVNTWLITHLIENSYFDYCLRAVRSMFCVYRFVTSWTCM